MRRLNMSLALVGALAVLGLGAMALFSAGASARIPRQAPPAGPAPLGGVVTTMTIRREPQMRQLLRIPDEMAVVAVLAMGDPTLRATRLRRDPVESFTTIDTVDGTPLPGPSA